MEELSSIILAGAIIPMIALVIKKIFIDTAFKNSKKELIIKNENGKTSILTLKTNNFEQEISNYLKNQKDIESEVQKTINKIINENKKLNLKFSKDSKYDFSLENNDIKIFIDVISNLKDKDSLIQSYKKTFKNNNEKLILINKNNNHKYKVDSDKLNNELSFISFSNKKNLNLSLEAEIMEKINSKNLKENLTKT